MKIAWFLIILGVLLFIDGCFRIYLGWANHNLLISLSGVLTGWILGLWVYSKGQNRRKSLSSPSGSETPSQL